MTNEQKTPPVKDIDEYLEPLPTEDQAALVELRSNHSLFFCPPAAPPLVTNIVRARIMENGIRTAQDGENFHQYVVILRGINFGGYTPIKSRISRQPSGQGI